MKRLMYLRGPEDVSIISELTGVPENVLLEKVNAADAENNLCIFELEVTDEQYRQVQQWKNERL